MPAKKILVADDEPHITHVVSLKLRNAGLDVVLAHDGEEALELALDELPDLIITDLQMPYMSGLELSRRLREHESTASIPVIMLTARGLGLAQDDLDQTSIRSVMSKPFSPKQILEKANAILGESPERSEAA
jgi:two-component system alkaline phosphatase synthesis response regulator PhoP